jgi:hypothetical protein
MVDDTGGVEYTLYNGMKVGTGLSSLMCILRIIPTNLLSQNTITRRFLTPQELQISYMPDVP